MTHSHDRFDFHVIDSVYGRNSDLYQDVLGVEPDATRKEIRAAFVDSRDEFFQFQSQVEKGDIVVTDGQLDFSKRRMDAVVAAFRILHDPNLRAFYDEARENRLQQGKSLHNAEDDPQDPVVQAVSRALGEKSPKRITPPRKEKGGSPLESSSGGDTPTSSLVEQRQSTSSPRRSLRNVFSAKRTKSSPSNTNYYMDEQEPPRSPKHKKTRRKHHPKQQQQQQEAVSLFISDNESVPGDDIGSSRNYRSERLRSRETLSTTDSSGVVEQQEEDDTYIQDGSNTLMTEERSVDDASTAISYYNDDDTLVVEEDLAALCCSNDPHRYHHRDQTLVSKTRTLLRAVKAEIRGSIKDTSSAFDQVCNAFTLQEQDIQAVRSKIDKASRQLHG